MRKPFLDAFSGARPERTPVWLMRQAGRYLPEYNLTKQEAGSFEKLCSTPRLACEVVMQPLRRFDLDAAILFADILTPLMNAGLEIRFQPGPFVGKPIVSEREASSLDEFNPEKDTPFVAETLDLIRGQISPSQSLIGFAAAPFTLMAYVTANKFLGAGDAKRFCYSRPGFVSKLLDRLAEISFSYLSFQIENGADAVQLFDTWAGELSAGDFREFAKPPVKKVIGRLKAKFPQIPLIYFVNGSGHLLHEIADLNFDGLGVDFRTPLETASKILGPQKTLQGNLDPFKLFDRENRLMEETDETLRAGLRHGRYVFNLGHGINKETPPENVKAMVNRIRSSS